MPPPPPVVQEKSKRSVKHVAVFCMCLVVIAASFFYIATSSGSLATAAAPSASSPQQLSFSPRNDQEKGERKRRRRGRNGKNGDAAYSSSSHQDEDDESSRATEEEEGRYQRPEEKMRSENGGGEGRDPFPPILSLSHLARTLDNWRLRHEHHHLYSSESLSKRSFRVLPLKVGATYEPYQPHNDASSSSGAANKSSRGNLSSALLCDASPLSFPENDDKYVNCRAPGINNVLFTQHLRWYCIHTNSKKLVSFPMRDRFCNKGTSEKIRYSSILQLRWDKLVLPKFLSKIVVPQVVASPAVASEVASRNHRNSDAIDNGSSSNNDKKKPQLHRPHVLSDSRMCKWGVGREIEHEIGFETIASLDQSHRELREIAAEINNINSSSNDNDRNIAESVARIKTEVSFDKKTRDAGEGDDIHDPFWCNVWFADPLGRTATCDSSTPLHICLHASVDAVHRTAKEAEAEAVRTAFVSSSASSSAAAPFASGTLCWHDIPSERQPKLANCGWLDATRFYFTAAYWRSRRLMDVHSRYYLAARVAASMLFATAGQAISSSSPISNTSTTSGSTANDELATTFYSSSQKFNGNREVRTLPRYISVHLRRGDYQHHCAKVKRGSVKEWNTFSKSPAAVTSLFLASHYSSSSSHNPLLKNTPLRSVSSPEKRDPAIPGCFPSLVDIELAFDHLCKATGITNFFVATNTPQELVDAGIVDPFDDGPASAEFFSSSAEEGAKKKKKKKKKQKGEKQLPTATVDESSNHANYYNNNREKSDHAVATMSLAASKRNATRNNNHHNRSSSSSSEQGVKRRKWRAVVLPPQTAKLFFEKARGVDDVILEMALLSLGRAFVLNRFSSFSATALEMAILRQHVAEDPSGWDNVVTW